MFILQTFAGTVGKQLIRYSAMEAELEAQSAEILRSSSEAQVATTLSPCF